MVLFVLVLLIVCVPLLELYVIIQVSHVVGAWETIALLLAESLLGAWILKKQGLGVLRRINEQLRANQLPHRELVDGFLIVLAGTLMLAPGFITDGIGFLLLIPPVRAGVRGLVLRRFQRRLGRGLGWIGMAGRATTAAGATRVWVDSTVVDTSRSSRQHPEIGPGATR